MFQDNGNVLHFGAPKGGFARRVSRVLQGRDPQDSSLALESTAHRTSRSRLSRAHRVPRPPHTVHAAVPSNTYAIYGNGQDKDMAELVPGILNQLGPDSLASLKRMAESYNAAQAAQAGKGAAAEPDDDDVPDLVENFDVDEKAGDAPAASSLEEVSRIVPGYERALFPGCEWLTSVPLFLILTLTARVKDEAATK